MKTSIGKALSGIGICSYPLSLFLSLSQPAYGMVPFFSGKSTYSRIENCRGSDQRIVGQIQTSLTQCIFDTRGYQPKLNDYLNCNDSLLSFFNSIQENSCKQSQLAKIKNQLVQNLIYHAQTLSQGGVGTQSLNQIELNRFFNHFNSWYKKATEALYLEANNRTLFPKAYGKENVNSVQILQEDVQKIMAEFWNRFWVLTRNVAMEIPLGIYAIETQTQPPSQQIFTQGLSSLTQVVRSAIETEVEPEIGFLLFDQVVAHFDKRIQFFTDLSDFSCQLQKCTKESTQLSELFTVSSLLSRLNTPFEEGIFTDVNDSLLRIRDIEVREFLKAIFSQPEKTERVFQKMVRHMNKLADRELTPPTVSQFSNLSIQNIPFYAVSFTSQITRIWNRTQNALNTGVFYKTGVQEVPFGLTQNNIEKIKLSLSRYMGSLDGLLTDFQITRNQMAQHFQNKNQLEMTRIQLGAEYQQQVASLVDLRNDLKGHQAALSDNRVNQYSNSILAFFKTEKYKNIFSKMLSSGSRGVFSLSPRDAKNDFSTKSLLDVAVQKNGIESISLKEGEIISFDVRGNWSPTCALEKSRYSAMTAPLIGPEGFVITGSLSKSALSSASDFKSSRDFSSDTLTHSTTVSDTTSSQKENVTAGTFVAGVGAAGGAVLGAALGGPAGASLGMAIGGAIGGIFGSTSEREYQNHSTTTATVNSQSEGSEISWGSHLSTTDSDEQRTSASFEMGLRTQKYTLYGYASGKPAFSRDPRGRSAFIF